MAPPFTIDNRTGYSTEDLHKLLTLAFDALGVRYRKHVLFKMRPGCDANDHSCSGCGQFPRLPLRPEGVEITIRMGPPPIDMPDLALVVEHEILHTLGWEHRRMRRERPELMRSTYKNPVYPHSPRWLHGHVVRWVAEPYSPKARVRHTPFDNLDATPGHYTFRVSAKFFEEFDYHASDVYCPDTEEGDTSREKFCDWLDKGTYHQKKGNSHFLVVPKDRDYMEHVAEVLNRYYDLVESKSLSAEMFAVYRKLQSLAKSDGLGHLWSF